MLNCLAPWWSDCMCSETDISTWIVSWALIEKATLRDNCDLFLCWNVGISRRKTGKVDYFIFICIKHKKDITGSNSHTHTRAHTRAHTDTYTQMLLQKGTSNHHRHCVTCDHAHNLVLIMTQWQHHDLHQSSRSRNNKPACNRCYERCSSLLWRRQFSIME